MNRARRVAVLSVHTSPLAQPGSGDGGGMNVYVRALAASLARAGVACDVLTRADAPGLASVVEVEPGFRVVHLEAGPTAPVSKHDLVDLVDDLTAAARDHLDRWRPDVLHANYWISGAVGHRLKHEMNLPLVATFHTLARVKAEAGIDDDVEDRTRLEHEIIGCADLMLASTASEVDDLVHHYDGVRDRVAVVPPGVDHDRFNPGTPAERAATRGALGLDDRPVLLFAGRIQPLKGADLAVRSLAALEDRRAVLLVVGGPSGIQGEREAAALRALSAELGVADRIRWLPPQPHDAVAALYRIADVCVVPSRAESFGLVALEAAACGTPVVAAAVGGLTSIVVDGETGYLVESRAAEAYAGPIDRLLDDPVLAARIGATAEARARRFGWTMTAARLRRLLNDLVSREPVSCR
ncbi:MAG: glycosyltransferase [Actinomycetes bacterium]